MGRICPYTGRGSFASINPAKKREEKPYKQGPSRPIGCKEETMQKAEQKEYQVYRLNRNNELVLVDTVFFTGYTVEEVRKSLIDHDGYSCDICVVEVGQ